VPPHRAVGSPTRFRPFSAVTACVSWRGSRRPGWTDACVCGVPAAPRVEVEQAAGALLMHVGAWHMHSGMQAGAAAVLPFARSASTRARRVSLLLTSSHGPGTRPGFSRRPGEADSRPAPPVEKRPGYACATRPPRLCPAHRSSDRIRRTVTVTVSVSPQRAKWVAESAAARRRRRGEFVFEICM
jgi:hypothetical protein